jgi:hypothetical protein
MLNSKIIAVFYAAYRELGERLSRTHILASPPSKLD